MNFSDLIKNFTPSTTVIINFALAAIILIIGCSVLTFILFDKLDFSWSSIVQSAPEGHFSVVRPASDDYLPWPGLLMGVPFLGFWYWATNQYIVQRILVPKASRMLAGALYSQGF